MSDRLAPLLAQFELRCQVLQAGGACGSADYPANAGIGHLHLLRRGSLSWQAGDAAPRRVDQPSLLLFAGQAGHRIAAEPGAELVCASVSFGAQFGNPLLRGLPNPWLLPLAELPMLAGLLELFFDEAFASRCGRAAMLDRLSELLVIQLLRVGFQQGLLQAGPLAGLAEPRLARALTAIHEAPARAWTLERLAETAGMSRARFAAQFAAVVGTPPGDYLSGLRMGIAQRLLSRGQPLKAVASEVGYGSANALSRAFQQRLGQTPSDWLRQQTPGVRLRGREVAA